MITLIFVSGFLSNDIPVIYQPARMWWRPNSTSNVDTTATPLWKKDDEGTVNATMQIKSNSSDYLSCGLWRQITPFPHVLRSSPLASGRYLLVAMEVLNSDELAFIHRLCGCQRPTATQFWGCSL